jgi:hypothetical protein
VSTTISSEAMPAARAVGVVTFGRACLRVRGDYQNTASRPRAVVNTSWERFSRARSRIRSSSLAHLAGRWSRFGVVPGSPGRRLVLEVPWQAWDLPGAGGSGQDMLQGRSGLGIGQRGPR